MIHVDNAIILAAGSSTRLEPLSHETPKALLKINGEVLIERQIRQLIDRGISDITIVTGYKSEMFSYLREKFRVSLLYNPYYLSRNNHASLYVSRDKLNNTFISCGDLLFVNNPFHVNCEFPYYATEYAEGPTGEWCVSSDKSGRIINVAISGRNAWIMRGEALFDNPFSTLLKDKLIRTMQNPRLSSLYWEDLYVNDLTTMTLYEKRNAKGNVMEFDSLEELREQIPQYRNHSNNKIMEYLSETLHCEENELTHFEPIKGKDKKLVCGVSFEYSDSTYEFLYGTNRLRRI